MTAPIVYGIPLSMFVRKVLVVMEEKNLPYENKPVTPMSDDEDWAQRSPLRKIPVYHDGDQSLPDSSIICAYLERKHPQPALYPTNDYQYGRAQWFEEYADTKLAEVLSPIFVERFVNVKFMQKEADEEVVKQALEVTIPPVLDYFEEQIGDKPFLVGGHFSIADIAVTSQFANFALGGEEVDSSRWPQLADYIKRMHARPAYKAALEAGAQ